MGRNKIKIQKIPSERTRLATFNKRKAGLLKKAMELSILCDCEVALLIIGTNNRPTVYSSSDFENLWQRYTQSQMEMPTSPPLTNDDYSSLYEKDASKKPPSKKARLSPEQKNAGSHMERPSFHLPNRPSTNQVPLNQTPVFQNVGQEKPRYLPPLPPNNFSPSQTQRMDSVSPSPPFQLDKGDVPVQHATTSTLPLEQKAVPHPLRPSASNSFPYLSDEKPSPPAPRRSMPHIHATSDDDSSLLPSIRTPEVSNDQPLTTPAQRRSQYAKRVNRKNLSLHIPNINSLPPAYPRLSNCRTNSPSAHQNLDESFSPMRGDNTPFPSPSSYLVPGTPSLPSLNTPSLPPLDTPTPSAFAQWGQSLPPPSPDGGSPSLPSASQFLAPHSFLEGSSTPLGTQFPFPRVNTPSTEKRKLSEMKA